MAITMVVVESMQMAVCCHEDRFVNYLFTPKHLEVIVLVTIFHASGSILPSRDMERDG